MTGQMQELCDMMHKLLRNQSTNPTTKSTPLVTSVTVNPLNGFAKATGKTN
jgi:hypothetical protein